MDWVPRPFLEVSVVLRKSLAGALVLGLAIGGLVASAPAASADSGSVTFLGHGWGHGRGMGQYGALGYAVDYGQDYSWILGHYYGGSHLAGDAGNPVISVELTRVTGIDTIVQGTGIAVNGTLLGDGGVRLHSNGDGSFRVDLSPGCGGGWWTWGTLGSGVTITSTANLITVCEPTKTTTYTGAIRGVFAGGQQYTINDVPTQEYLRGVVPRESPASWGDSGGGRGMQALKAQAVAARSYALASGGRTSGAQTCDTTACQVYGGWAEMPYATNVTKQLWDSRTDAAVDATAGQVMRWDSGGAIARTEFSSSTGGWTAGGNFTAVEDLGDATASNSNHTWSQTFSLDAVAAGLGTSTIRSIAVTQRNGLGAEGGRVKQVVVTDTLGRTASFTGDQVRQRLGLKSDWFSISSSSRAAAQAVVRAMYADVLGREPDPAGLDSWTTLVMTTNNARLVADGIVNSKERLQALVSAEYVRALHRFPESTGLANWVGWMERGATVSDLQIGIFASQESLAVLGGGDVRAWVAGMYQELLRRPAGPAEIDAWYQVAVTQGREAAVAGIARAPEAGMQRLLDYYQRYLGRGLDPAGVATWLPEMAGRGDFTIPGMIGGSQEYWNRAQTRF